MRNPRVWRRFWILLLTPASLLVLKGARGCPLAPDSGSGDPDAPDIELTVRLENLETPVLGEAVHLFGSGETFPCCQVEPGLSRTIVYTARQNDHVDFQAGRNGTILANKRCTCTSVCPERGTSSPATVRVTWNGSALACVGW